MGRGRVTSVKIDEALRRLTEAQDKLEQAVKNRRRDASGALWERML